MFKIRVAELNILIHNIYPYCESFCAAYRTEFDTAYIEVEVTEEEILAEKAASQSAFPIGYYEAVCVNRHIALRLPQFGAFVFHASVVECDGKAYAFAAPSGTGKSTHTKLWMRVFGDRVQLLNDDKPALRRIDGVWYAYGTPWSGKHDLSVNMRAPVAGICVLARGEVNKIEQFGGFAAVHALMEQTSRAKYGNASSAKILARLDVLMREVPIWRLECNMDPEAAILSHRVMSGENE